MIACIAPSDYDETLSTLRYADQARRIRTRAIVNQDSLTSVQRDAQIMTLQQQITTLQQQITMSTNMAREGQKQKEMAARMEETQLEEYQKQVERMQRLMEETRLVSECRIRALSEENEALKVHLKLAVESLKQPIVLPKRFPSTSVSRLPVHEEQEEEQAHGDGLVDGDGKEGEGEEEGNGDDGYISAEYAEYEDEEHDLEEMHDVQAQMQELLDDLGLFRRKLGDDRGRFVGLGRGAESVEGYA